MRRLACGVVLAWICAVALPATAFAQASGIAGVVRDTSGAVMPGVTVEASSPALIERVRSVTTDTQGQFKIVDQFFDVGIASIVSLLTTCRLSTFWVSTMGLAPVTVTVSSSAPTRRSALTVAVKVAGSSIPSRLIVENPGRVKVTM